MFYDERIEGAKGKISKTAVILAGVISLVYGIAHGINLFRNAPSAWNYCFLIPELTVFFGSVTVLVLGFAFYRRGEADERREAEEERFYWQAASLLVKIVFGVFAFFLPMALYAADRYRFADYGYGVILYILFFILGAYVIDRFRHHDIYFNYSLMDSEHYMHGVWRNIGKFALYVLGYIGIAVSTFVFLIFVKQISQGLLLRMTVEMLGYGIGVLIECAALYLLYSFLERTSYQSEGVLSRSVLLSLGVTMLIAVLYTGGIVMAELLPLSQAGAVQLVSSMFSIDTAIHFALLIFLTYFVYEYERLHQSKLLSLGYRVILINELLFVLLGQLTSGVLFILMPEIMEQESYVINQILANAKTALADASSLANVVGFTLIVFALVKAHRIHKANRLLPVVFVILGGIELFLRTQIDALQVTLYHSAVEVGVLIYFLILVACLIRRSERESVGHGGET